MSILRSRLLGVIMVVFTLIIGLYYSLCIFFNGAEISLFKSERFFGIPILSDYWTIALPIYIGIMILLILIAWLGLAAILTKEIPPKIEEERVKIQKLDAAIRKQTKN